MSARQDAIKAAAHAHTDLNTFAAVVSILEGGHLYCPESREVADEIIQLCRDVMQDRLADYDRATGRTPA